MCNSNVEISLGPGSAVEKKTKKIGERCEPSSSPPQSTARLALLVDFFFFCLFAVSLRFSPYFSAVEPGHRTFSGRPQKKGQFLSDQ